MNPLTWSVWTWISVLSAVIVMAWCGWRINRTPGLGEWPLKLILLALFASAGSCAADLVVQGNWDWAEALLLCSMAAYCVWGYLRDRKCRCGLQPERALAPATINHDEVHP